MLLKLLISWNILTPSDSEVNPELIVVVVEPIAPSAGKIASEWSSLPGSCQ
jgi:hypothetical protein